MLPVVVATAAAAASVVVVVVVVVVVIVVQVVVVVAAVVTCRCCQCLYCCQVLAFDISPTPPSPSHHHHHHHHLPTALFPDGCQFESTSHNDDARSVMPAVGPHVDSGTAEQRSRPVVHVSWSWPALGCSVVKAITARRSSVASTDL